MSRREDLLRGILGADQIGFHLFEYARHFLTTCRRLLVHSISSHGGIYFVPMKFLFLACVSSGVQL